MLEGRPKKAKMRSIAPPVISFAVLAALVVGAVLFGNLVVDRMDGCRPFGSSSQNSGADDVATLLVYSNEEDAVMLCNVPQETVEYEAPQTDSQGILIGDSLYLIVLEEDDEMPAEIEGNDLFRDDSGYIFPPEDRRTLVYVKGEFGSLEDCGLSDERFYESDDLDGFDGSDMFHPDRIQSCWIEIDVELFDVR